MSIDRWIERHASFSPHAPAIADERSSYSYGALARRIGAAAAALCRLGIGRGDRLAYLGLNSADMLVLLFAAARLGAIFVPLNWRLAPPELGHIIADCGASVLFHDAALAEAAKAVPEAEKLARISLDPAGARPFADLLDTVEGAPSPALAAGEDAPVLLVYTSGTTGRPKGAVLGHRALEANAQMSLHMHAMSAADHVLTVLPMFHVGGLNIQTLPALYCGGRVTLHARFQPDATLSAIAADRPTLTVQVPATLRALIEHPRWASTDLSSLRALATGSSVVPQSLIDAVEAKGVPVLVVYGATETAPICVYHRVDIRLARRGSTGRPGLLADIRIVDQNGSDAPAGAPGEIWVRGPATFSRYWNDGAATAEALASGGWFRTGDIAERDANWDIAVRDRLKNVIISGGENIYPAELERVLHQCPHVREAAVVGRADARWGEVPVAVVVRAEGAKLDREAVLALFDGELARYKHPRDVVFIDRLPRNVMGKVLHFELREAVAARTSPG